MLHIASGDVGFPRSNAKSRLRWKVKLQRCECPISWDYLKIVAPVKTIYELARADLAGVIDGLTIVLVDGGKPESLPRIRDSLEGSGKSLQEICNAALKTVAPHTKGVWEEVAEGAVEPLIKAISDGIGALWKSSVDKDKLATDTKKTKLEAARWPEFGDIAPR
jgi:hypothetical protein